MCGAHLSTTPSCTASPPPTWLCSSDFIRAVLELQEAFSLGYSHADKAVQARMLGDLLLAISLHPGRATENAVRTAEKVLPRSKKAAALAELKKAQVHFKRKQKQGHQKPGLY